MGALENWEAISEKRCSKPGAVRDEFACVLRMVIEQVRSSGKPVVIAGVGTFWQDKRNLSRNDLIEMAGKHKTKIVFSDRTKNTR